MKHCTNNYFIISSNNVSWAGYYGPTLGQPLCYPVSIAVNKVDGLCFHRIYTLDGKQA